MLISHRYAAQRLTAIVKRGRMVRVLQSPKTLNATPFLKVEDKSRALSFRPLQKPKTLDATPFLEVEKNSNALFYRPLQISKPLDATPFLKNEDKFRALPFRPLQKDKSGAPVKSEYTKYRPLSLVRTFLKFNPRPTVERSICSNHRLIYKILRHLGNAEGKIDKSDFADFASDLRATLKAWEDPDGGEDTPPVFESLRQAYVDNALPGLALQIKYLYQGSVVNRQLADSDKSEQIKLADLRYPVEWYPATRTLHRAIHLHVGPTNSGKTYNALKRLEQATSGIYAGPLRLLAHEVYTRLNNRGKPCNLVTGDERIVSDDKDAKMSSCTVEMVPINIDVDVAVIDEIQMIGDEDRGWAWTQALLGTKAKELHLCGEARTVPLIRELAASMGDKLEIHYYKRLSPLKTMSSSLNGGLKSLQKGDCVVAFSRLTIHALKLEIEELTKKQVAVVYGSLPPETRAQQAGLFNDPNNDYDFLVASDAIGMGLNLSIKRLIFESTMKFNGRSMETVPNSQIKQIAGRAGRYRTAMQDQQETENTSEPNEGSISKKSLSTPSAQNTGLVTTLERTDYQTVLNAMQSEPEPVMTAGILPPANIIQRFATYFPPNTPFSYILLRLHEISLIHPRFRLCTLKYQLRIADVIQAVPNLTIRDRIIFIAAPVKSLDPGVNRVVQALAERVANNESGALLDIKEIDLSILDKTLETERDYLYSLESLHNILILYLWLSHRFTDVFTSREMVSYVKTLVEDKINAVLAIFSASKARIGLRPFQGEAIDDILSRQKGSDE